MKTHAYNILGELESIIPFGNCYEHTRPFFILAIWFADVTRSIFCSILDYLKYQGLLNRFT